MDIYDIIMLVVLVSAAVFGAIKGFAWQLASIASIVVSYFVAYRFREPLSQSIQAEAPWNLFLAMLILFIGTSLVIWVGFRMVSNTIDRLKLREFDRQIGFLFGLAKGGLYCTLITLFAVTLMGETVRGKIVASKSGNFIARTLDRSESVIPEEIHDVVRPYLERFEERFQGGSADSGAPVLDVNGVPIITEGTVSDWMDTATEAFQNARQDAQSSLSGGNSGSSDFGQNPAAPFGNYPPSSSSPPPLSF